MKKDKEKSLVKKARKDIQKSLEELLTAEITKSIISQGRDPKKVTSEVKKAVSIIAKKLAKKAGLSKAESTDETSSDVEAPKEEVNSFEVAPVAEEKAPAVKRVRTPSKIKAVKTDASLSPLTPAIRKRGPRKAVAKAVESVDEFSVVTETENN